MQVAPSARASLVLSLLACNDPTVADADRPTPPPAQPQPPAAPPKLETPPPTPRNAPETMPPPLAEVTTPPGRPPPPGSPSEPGRVGLVVALDEDRAVVQFYTPNSDRKWWLAQIHRDGSLAWARPLAGDLAAHETMTVGAGGPGVAIAGDAVTVTTSERVGDDTRVTIHGFALADGAPRFSTELGPGFLTGSMSDGRTRFDTRVHDRFDGPENECELAATGPQGVAWRARIGDAVPVGHDPTAIGDVVAVRSEQRRSRDILWQVFDRTSGAKRGDVTALPQSCSDGQRWLLLGKDGLLSVDPTTLATRVVLPPPTLPGAAGTWALEDCTFAGGAPVVLVARGRRKALVALDRATLAIAGHVEIGTAAVGMNGFDPLPAQAPRVLALRTLMGEGEELLLADPAGGRVIGRWRGRGQFASMGGLTPYGAGVVLTTEHTLSVVRGDTGEIEGRAIVENLWIGAHQIAGDTLWLPPGEPFVLGRRAPRTVPLAAASSDAVRDAVLADIQTAEQADAGKPPPCPDPRAVFRGDGIAVDAKLAPVGPSRLPPWDLDILRETARTLACAPGTATVRLLAWYVMEDDRPLRNDNAVMLVEGVGTPPRHALVSVYRHATNHEWNTIGSFHDRREPVRTYDHRPTRAEIDDFLQQAEWTFKDDWGKVIAGNVVDDEWRAATGEAPWVAFAPAIEQAE